MRSDVVRVGLVGAVCAAGLLAGTVVQAADVILESSDDSIELTEGDDGSMSGSITITNTSDSELAVSFEPGEDIATCVFTADPPKVNGSRTVTVEITSESCELPANPTTGLLRLEGAHPETIPLSVTGADAADDLEYWKVAVSFLVALVLALLVVGRVWSRRPRVAASAAALPTPDGSLPPVSGQTLGAPTVRLPLSRELDAPGDDWSFSDSWASTVSIGATVFVALFGATDVLTAVFGKKPAEVVNHLLIVSAVAAFAVGIAPLIVKSIGMTEKPTVGGVLAGAFATTVGVTGQIVGASWAIEDSAADDWVRNGAVVLGALALFITVRYCVHSLTVLFDDAFSPEAPAAPEITDELLLVATNLLPDGVRQGPPENVLRAVVRIATDLAAAKAAPPETDDYPDVVWARRTSPGDSPLGGRRRSVIL